MRPSTLSTVGIGALALVAAAALAPGATAARSPGLAMKTAGTHGTVAPVASCYAQRDNDAGVGIVTQNFEPSFDAYDTQGADDFTLTKPCKLKTVTADGTYFNGSGGITSVNVTYYKGGAHPRRVVKDFQAASFTDSGNGTLTIKTKGRAAKGRYWLALQANLAFSAGGEWGWLTNVTVRDHPAQWQNPGGGFDTHCTTWDDLVSCIPVGEGGDDSFSVN